MYKIYENINVFTDGACTANGKKNATAGIGIYFPDQECENISEKFVLKPITNQRAELYAILKALNIILSQCKCNKITVYTDSLYSINCLTKWIKSWKNNNWRTSTGKPVKNKDIIVQIDKILEENKDLVIFKHVNSHTGKKEFKFICNDKADELATNGKKL